VGRRERGEERAKKGEEGRGKESAGKSGSKKGTKKMVKNCCSWWLELVKMRARQRSAGKDLDFAEVSQMPF